MLNPSFIMLYVDNPTISAEFYARLLEKQPCQSSPSFAMFLLDNDYKLGLWAIHDVEPTVVGICNGGELGFPVTHTTDVDTIYAAWQKEGIKIAQPPMQMDFGYTFVALDPDGNRLRVYAYTSA